eukprot:CAMPEP_0175082430 /NCGR_PEP_ID=MMETSP0052_2-20121109/26750_1 /TAXON_ID=51329 ORGANISM="Polytomella parva, Strain SAG 63-3" /NCGR_SAMPLE_ID=MMETSP0052_2 /ASSEMBLY_ACC=CAM_ASM_000194 /LENGTH=466 /DNA_ID=CAMNT_0016353623 /DNA_START=367 /DNA_END=1770 /DNA_ORIENTATION=+
MESADSIVKAWCVPISKVTRDPVPLENDQGRPYCSLKEAAVVPAYLLALQKLADHCGLDHLPVRTWGGPLNAVIPGFNFHLSWDGLWMTRAKGLSVHQMIYNARFMRTNGMIDIIRKINRTSIVHAAMFDALTGQGDRHPENVFVGDDGGLSLIDNQNSLGRSQTHFSTNSVFLPGNQIFTIARLGAKYVSKTRGGLPRTAYNLAMLMDYRCYVDDEGRVLSDGPLKDEMGRDLAGVYPGSGSRSGPGSDGDDSSSVHAVGGDAIRDSEIQRMDEAVEEEVTEKDEKTAEKGEEAAERQRWRKREGKGARGKRKEGRGKGMGRKRDGENKNGEEEEEKGDSGAKGREDAINKPSSDWNWDPGFPSTTTTTRKALSLSSSSSSSPSSTAISLSHSPAADRKGRAQGPRFSARSNLPLWDPEVIRRPGKSSVKGGRIGKRYPPKMQQCLIDIAQLSPTQVKKRYEVSR